MEHFSEKNLSLSPKMQGFLLLNEGEAGLDESNCHKKRKYSGKDITKACRGFQTISLVRKAVRRAKSDEAPFICKTSFILAHQEWYKFICPKAVLISLLADRVTLFRIEYQIYQTYHSYYRSCRNPYGRSKEDVLQYCREQGMLHAKTPEEQEYCQKILMHIEESTSNRKSLSKRIKELASEETEKLLLPREVLLSYRSCLHYYLPAKAQAGHYKAFYSKQDVSEYSKYVSRKQRLEKCETAAIAWKREDYKRRFDLSAKSYDSSGILNEDIEHLDEIFDAAKDFFASDKIKKDNLSSILENIMDDEAVDQALIPFHFLMVCISGTARLFSVPSTLKGSKVLEVCEKPYLESKPKSQQRISRIHFLYKLNSIYRLQKTDSSKNWKLFLQIHGAEIETQEEADLWHEILFGENVFFENPKEDIPVIELSLLCMEYLKRCVPIDYIHLYCCQSCHIMQRGSFRTFLDCYPDVLKECAKRIQRNSPKHDWNLSKRNYLREWQRPECSVATLQKICCDGAKAIRWNTIEKDFDKKMEEFCRSEYRKYSLCPKNVAQDVEELKSLLVEVALRIVLRDEAVGILAVQTEQCLNQSLDFKISLTGFRTLRPSQEGEFPK